jgi:hypothetical protein
MLTARHLLDTAIALAAFAARAEEQQDQGEAAKVMPNSVVAT